MLASVFRRIYFTRQENLYSKANDTTQNHTNIGNTLIEEDKEVDIRSQINILSKVDDSRMSSDIAVQIENPNTKLNLNTSQNIKDLQILENELKSIRRYI